MANKRPTTIRLTQADLDFADKLANHFGFSRSQPVAWVLKNYRQNLTETARLNGLNPADFGLGGDHDSD